MALTIDKCKSCGAPLDISTAVGGVVRCAYCRNTYTVVKHELDPAALGFIRQGEHDLDTGKFDDAYKAFSKACQLDESEPEAYWGMALAEFKVQYLKDIPNKRLQPICHEITDKVFSDNKNYKRALELATDRQRVEYERKAEDIDNIRKEFFKLKQSGKDYDCFICVKVTDDNTKMRTADYKDADDVYFELKGKGYKPFFSERELRNESGADYEARILYALYCAECMLVVCSNEEYLRTPWVENEYKRFLKLINDEEKESDSITIVYGGKPIEKLSGKNGKIQGIDINSLNAMERIVSFVESHSPEGKKRREQEKLKKQQAEEEYRRRQQELKEEIEKLKALTSQYAVSAVSDKKPEKAQAVAKKEEKKSKPCAKADNTKSKAKTESKTRESKKEIFSKASKYIATNGNIIAGLKTDGTVSVVGDEAVREEVSSWRNIVAISASNAHLVGLKADGSVVSVLMSAYRDVLWLRDIFDVSGWRDIVAISAGDNNIAGIKSDGTVVAVGSELGQKEVSDWRNIVAVSNGLLGCPVGLKCDGTVVVVDSNNIWQKEVKSWRDIVFVTGGGEATIAGLKRDGKLVPDYLYDDFLEANDWRDLVAVSVNDYFFVGLKCDGTVVSAGEWGIVRGDGGNVNKVSDVRAWCDIVAISSCSDVIVGLKSDGTVVAIWNDAALQNDLSSGVKNWKLFNNVNELK